MTPGLQWSCFLVCLPLPVSASAGVTMGSTTSADAYRARVKSRVARLLTRFSTGVCICVLQLVDNHKLHFVRLPGEDSQVEPTLLPRSQNRLWRAAP
jgi:hypothetical protein